MPLRVPSSVLAVLPVPVKVFVEVADPFVKFVQVVDEHPASHHFLLSDAPLQFISPPASEPDWALDQVFRVLFEVPQDPDVVIDTEQSPLLVPAIDHSGGWRRRPCTGQEWNPLREVSARQGHPAPQAPTCHCPSACTSTGHQTGQENGDRV